MVRVLSYVCPDDISTRAYGIGNLQIGTLDALHESR